MARVRGRLQGITNIIRFNWHFYLLSGLLVLAIAFLAQLFPGNLAMVACIIMWGIILVTVTSLLVSFYIYDLSGFYELNWLNVLPVKQGVQLLNIHAGFDETSTLLHNKYPDANLKVCDFYDEKKHTEVSIKRARKAYPPFPGTMRVTTTQLPFADKSMDFIYLIFAAHEIRGDKERIEFFNELSRICSDDGKIVVVEHQRDLANFLAYNIGYLHFLSPATWAATFSSAGLSVVEKKTFTPFVTIYTLQKNGNSY